MDVNATMKMNDMVKNLTRHGIISNSDEAIEMASRMYNVEKMENAPKEETQTDDLAFKEELKQLIDKRLSYFLEKHHSCVMKEIQDIWTHINQIRPDFERCISELKKEVGQTGIRETPQAVAEPPPVRSDKPEEHPKSGGFKENDVSVEKFFYCGQK